MISQRILSLGLATGLVWGSCFSVSFTPAAQLSEIQRRGKLIVGVKDNLAPLGFTDAQGNLQGLEIDLARHLAAELLGNPDAVVLQPVTNRERLNVVLEGKVDLTIARVSATVSRSRLVNFSRHYYLDSSGFITADGAIKTLGDLANTQIVVLNKSSTIAVVRHHLPNATLVGADSYEQALSLLEAGTAKVFAADRTILVGWVQEYPHYHLLPVRLDGDALCIVMPKGLQYTDLWLQVNNAIARWQTSGWLSERLAHWGLL